MLLSCSLQRSRTESKSKSRSSQRSHYMPESHDRPRSVPSVMPSLIFIFFVCLLYVCILYRRTSIIFDYFIAKVSSLRDFFLFFFLSLSLSFFLSFFRSQRYSFCQHNVYLTYQLIVLQRNILFSPLRSVLAVASRKTLAICRTQYRFRSSSVSLVPMF